MTKNNWKRTKAGQTWLRLYGDRPWVQTTRLHHERLRNGMSVKEAAEASGVPVPTWHGWELQTSNRRQPIGSHLVDVLRTFPRLKVEHLTTDPFIVVDPQTLKEVKHDPAA